MDKIKSLAATYSLKMATGLAAKAAPATTMSYYPFSFETEIVYHELGKYTYKVAFLPAELVGDMPFATYPRLRVSGEVGDIPFNAAWQPSKGRYFLMLSKALIKAGRYEIGDEVEVRFRIEDQDEVDVPVKLTEALAEHDAARATWDTLSAGKKRSFAHRVGSAKTTPTRERRVLESIEVLAAGETVPLGHPSRSRAKKGG